MAKICFNLELSCVGVSCAYYTPSSPMGAIALRPVPVTENRINCLIIVMFGRQFSNNIALLLLECLIREK